MLLYDAQLKIRYAITTEEIVSKVYLILDMKIKSVTIFSFLRVISFNWIIFVNKVTTKKQKFTIYNELGIVYPWFIVERKERKEKLCNLNGLR
jgi:hypothetical protein